MIIHNVEQGSDAWHTLRAGKPTASEFSKLITSKGKPSESLKPYAMTLAAEKYAGKPLDDWEGSGWMRRGKELEPDARDLYEFQHKCDVEQVGFITDDLERYGASPDGIMGDSGMTEIKCLKTEHHVKVLLDFKRTKKCPSGHVQQTQGQLLVAEREWDDLKFNHPDMPLLVIRQYRDEVLIKALQNQLAMVLDERDKILTTLQEF